MQFAAASLELVEGTTQVLTVTGTFDDGSSADVTGRATFASSDADVVAVSAGGTVTAVAPGVAIVSATVDSVQGNLSVSVIGAPPLELPMVVDTHFTGRSAFSETPQSRHTEDATCPTRAGDRAGQCHRFVWAADGLFTGTFWTAGDDFSDLEARRIAAGPFEVTFWAWGASGGERIQFGAGIDTYDGAEDRTLLTLTATPERYTVRLHDLATAREVYGAFLWAANRTDNPSGFTFYIDDIQWRVAPIQLPMVVDDYFTGRSGFGEGGPPLHQADNGCQIRRPDAAGECHRFTWGRGLGAFTGSFWTAGDDFVDLRSRAVEGVALEVTFTAWSTGGGAVIRFGAGNAEFDGAEDTAVFALSTTPTRYAVPLPGVGGRGEVVGAFSWAANRVDNPNGFTFYVDDIQWRAPIEQEAYVKASNTDPFDFFGVSVALFEDTLVVGATGENSGTPMASADQTDNTLRNNGAAYVSVREHGVWTQQAYLKSSRPSEFSELGASVDISGDTVVVGAHRRRDTTRQGAVYVFVRVDGVWSEQAVLEAFNGGDGASFGSSVAISGDTVVVGDSFEDDRSGAAYVFVRSNGAWRPQAYLEAPDPDPGDNFGFAVDVVGDVAVVGAPYEDSSATRVGGDAANDDALDSGAAYVFVRSGASWAPQAYLKAPDGRSRGLFGSSVAASADRVAVGAPDEERGGSAYLFARASTVWVTAGTIRATPAEDGDGFGGSVALSGDLLLVGAVDESSGASGVDGDPNNNDALGSGAAYLFIREDRAWVQRAYLKASNPSPASRFGRSVAVSGDTLAVGATGESSAAIGVDGDQTSRGAEASGAVYVFR